MFVIRANFSDSFEAKASADKTIAFLSDFKNYVDLTPNLQDILQDGRGEIRWIVAAEIPFVGKMRQNFGVSFYAADNLIEWLPSPSETRNFLRVVAEVIEKESDRVTVKYSQFVEIRRAKASELHPLANMAGERAISEGLQTEVGKMARTFIAKAKEKLETL